MKLKDAWSWKGSYEQPRELIKKTETSICQQSLYSQSYVFSSSHIQIALLSRNLSLLVITQYGAEFSVLYTRYLLVLYLYIVMNLWCRRRLLGVLWTARRPNQSILKEIKPKYSLEGLMLKLQYFGHLM